MLSRGLGLVAPWTPTPAAMHRHARPRHNIPMSAHLSLTPAVFRYHPGGSSVSVR